MKMPAQKPHKSKQDYETPDDLIEAVVRRFGPLEFDLAATAKNRKAPGHFNPKEDTFKQDWSQLTGNLWLNPPFGRIAPFAERCKETVWRWQHVHSSSRLPFTIFLLTPASVGSNWFLDHVWGHAAVFALNPRLQFVGEKDPYPKDCMISAFGMKPGFEIWRWKP